VANGQRLRGRWQQPGFQAILVLDRVPTSNATAPATMTAEAYKTEEVRVSSPSSPNAEIGLGGTLRLPLGAGPFPAVVLLADVGAAKGAPHPLLTELADALARQGLAVLSLDDRGTGRSAAVPSANTSADLVADIQSALQFLRTRPGIDPMRVGVVGHGAGANVALLAAAQAPSPAFLIALGAAGVSGQEQLARQTSLVNQSGEADTAQLVWNRKNAQGHGLGPPRSQKTAGRRHQSPTRASAAGPGAANVGYGSQETQRCTI
jgi:dienelactone hydrolase